MRAGLPRVPRPASLRGVTKAQPPSRTPSQTAGDNDNSPYCDGVRPEHLARDAGQRLRAWLRGRWPRRPSEHGQPWFISDQAAEARQLCLNERPRVSRAVARGWPSPLAPVTTMAPDRPASEQLSWRDVQIYADAVPRICTPSPAFGAGCCRGPGRTSRSRRIPVRRRELDLPESRRAPGPRRLCAEHRELPEG